MSDPSSPPEPGGRPTYQQPGYQQPGYQQPGYQQPGYQQPGYQQPGYQQPGYPPPPSYPPAPTYPQQGWAPPPQEASGLSWREVPRPLRPVVVLLLVNLALSLVLTVVTVLLRHSIVAYQLDHRHITDPQQRDLVRSSYVGAIVGRVIGNVVVSIVYVFLVRALVRGRRWAYRRVIWLGGAGIVGLLLLQTTPYPAWMRVEQLLQAAVLAALLWFVLRPEVKAHFASGLPGRDVRRFNRR